MPDKNITKIQLPDGNVYNVKDDVSGYTTNTGTVTSISAGDGLTTGGGAITTSGTIGHSNSVTAQTTSGVYPIKIDAQGHISEYGTAVTIPPKMSILSYGKSTWNDFITAYKDNAIVYCRASSNSNPAAGSQTRLAFMAYVNNAENPTNVEFQYYRSVSSHSSSQQGDQVYVYTLTSAGNWSVIVREASVKVAASSPIVGTYSKGTMTLSHATSGVTAQATSAVYPFTVNETGHITAVGSAVTSMTPTSHTHGNIQNGGELQTTDVAIATGDKLVVTDNSDSDKVARTSLSFDTANTSAYLRKDGTWATPAGGVTDVTVNGTSVVSSGVAAVTVPTLTIRRWGS